MIFVLNTLFDLAEPFAGLLHFFHLGICYCLILRRFGFELIDLFLALLTLLIGLLDTTFEPPERDGAADIPDGEEKKGCYNEGRNRVAPHPIDNFLHIGLFLFA